MCGRSDQPVVVPAGLTAAFNDFIASGNAKQNYTRVTITALEGTSSVTYWGRIDHLITTTGMVVLRMQLTQRPDARVPSSNPARDRRSRSGSPRRGGRYGAIGQPWMGTLMRDLVEGRRLERAHVRGLPRRSSTDL